MQASAKTALLEALKRCRERGDAELWIALCDATLDSGLVTAASERADLLTEKAKVFSDDLLRDADATTALNAALALVDDHEAAQDALSQLEMVAGNWQKIVKKFADEAKVSTDRQLTTGLLTNIGETHYRSGRPGKAIEVRKQAEERCDELGDNLGLAEALRGHGKAYLLQGDLAKARECIGRAVDLFASVRSSNLELYQATR